MLFPEFSISPSGSYSRTWSHLCTSALLITGVHHLYKSRLRPESGFFHVQIFVLYQTSVWTESGQNSKHKRIRNWKFRKNLKNLKRLKNFQNLVFQIFNFPNLFNFKNETWILSRPSPDSNLVLIWSRQNPDNSLDKEKSRLWTVSGLVPVMDTSASYSIRILY